jgi:hypothetical protein
MPIAVEWLDSQKTMIYINHVGNWGLEDFQGMIARVRSLAADIDHAFTLIADFTQSGVGVKMALTMGRSFEGSPSPYLIQSYLVNPPGAIRTLLKVVSSVFSIPHYTTVNSLEEAVADTHRRLEGYLP